MALVLLAALAVVFLPPPRVEAAWTGLIRFDDPHLEGQERLGALFGATDGFVIVVTGEPPAARHAAETIAAQVATWSEVHAVAAPRAGFDVPGALSADGRHAAVYVEIKPDAATGASARRLLERLPDLERPDGVTVRAAGGVLEEVEIAIAVERDLLEIVPLVLLGLALASWWLLRAPGAAFSILVTLGLVLVLTLASVGFLFGALTTITCLAIPIVMTIAAANAVHLTFRLRRDRRALPLDEALRRTRRRGGQATALAAITTGIGFLALLVMQMPDFQRLAVLGAVGCTWTWVVVVGVLPSLLSRFDRVDARSPAALDRLVDAARSDLGRRPGSIALTVVFVLLVMGVGAIHLTSGTHGLEQIPDDSNFQEVSRLLDEELGGTITLEVILDGPEDWRSEEGVERLRDVDAGLRAAIPDATMVVSAVDLVDLARQKLPQATPAQVFGAAATGLLGPLPVFLDDTGRVARFTVRLETTTTAAVLDHVAQAERSLRSMVKDGERAEVVGVYRLIATSVEAAVRGQALACLLSIAFVSLVASLALRSWRSIPVIWAANLLPLLALGGLLGWIGQPISISTAVVGSVVFGLVVDDTLHFLYALKEEGDGDGAARRALVRLGPAFVATSVVLLTGALVTSLGRVPASVVFGRLMAVGVVLALLCVLFVAPRVAQRLSRPPRG